MNENEKIADLQKALEGDVSEARGLVSEILLLETDLRNTCRYVLKQNEAGLVLFPDSGAGFSRYGPVDTGGMNRGKVHGKGDHYVLPEVAASLFEAINELYNGFSITMRLGDMSAENGSDPWTPGTIDHHGHGHDGRSGMDIDFRYLDKNGNDLAGKNCYSSKSFSMENNQTIYNVASLWGFKSNYQGTGRTLANAANDGGHNDHGHLGWERNK